MTMLKEKTAVITGGTRGIGLATVQRFLEEGAFVALFGSRKESVDKALAELEETTPGAKVIGFSPDLRNPEEIKEAFEAVRAQYGSIDVLVNNAGMSASEPLDDYKPEDFEKIMSLNVNAVFNCSQAAVRFMKEQDGGVILNTSSMVSIYGQPAGCGYPASKFAVNGLTKSLARELGRDNIRVNAVAPGITRTDMVAALPEEVIEPLIATIPLGRVAEPVDIANAFVFLASDLASYITGAVLSVDGATMT